jgi:hypothetical protein
MTKSNELPSSLRFAYRAFTILMLFMWVSAAHAARVEKTIHFFWSPVGYTPNGLLLSSSGTLYGVTTYGGALIRIRGGHSLAKHRLKASIRTPHPRHFFLHPPRLCRKMLPDGSRMTPYSGSLPSSRPVKLCSTCSVQPLSESES